MVLFSCCHGYLWPALILGFVIVGNIVECTEQRASNHQHRQQLEEDDEDYLLKKYHVNHQLAARFAPIELYNKNGKGVNGISAQRGELGMDLDPTDSFERVTTIEFTGLSSAFPIRIQRHNKPGQMPEASPSAPPLTSVVWYGEETTRNGSGSASLMIDDETGHLFGSISDGSISYSIKTVMRADNAEFHFEFEAIPLGALPEEYEAPPREQERQQPPSGDRDSGGGDDTAGERRWLSLRGNHQFRSHSSIPNKEQQQQERHLADDPVVVDVLALYTQNAKIAQGGEAGIKQLIDLGIVQTNTAFENSGSTTRVRLAAALEDTTFPDDGTMDASNVLDALDNSRDGFLDNMDSLRSQHGGDIVVLIANDLGNYCGAAFFGGYLGTVHRICATLDGKYSFAHEVGHMFLAMHDRIAAGPRGLNRAYYDTENCFRSVMSYDVCGLNCEDCPRELYYSTRRTKYEGHAMGTWYENNIDTMDYYAPILAGLKDAPPDAEHESNTAATPYFQLCNHRPCEDHPLAVSLDHNPRSDSMTIFQRDNTALNERDIGVAEDAVITWDNVISRIDVPGGYYIEVFEQEDYRGTRRVFGGVNTNTGAFMDRFFITEGYGLGDSISSYVVREIPGAHQMVKLCRRTNCRGGMKEYSVGSFKSMPRRQIGNDLSRVDLPPKWSIELFDLPNFQGESKYLVNEDSNTWKSIQLVGENAIWEDRAQSFIVSTID